MVRQSLASRLLKERMGPRDGSAYQAGRGAFNSNKGFEKCPYDDAALRAAWQQGWQDAQKEFDKS
jgi:ribosome modulation factor